MSVILYIGDHKLIRPEFIRYLAERSFEYVCFSRLEDASLYLETAELSMIMFPVDDKNCQTFNRDLVELNDRINGKTPIVLLTKSDTLSLRKAFMNHSFVRFFQYHDTLVDAVQSFERLEQEIEASMQMRKLRFAVLDDDRLQLFALRQLFERHGLCDVSYFCHPRELAAASQSFDVYLIDLVLPETSGEEIIFKLRHAHPDVAILAISAQEEKEVIANVLYLGADDFIVKPYNDTILMAKLHGSARMRALLKENIEKTKELKELTIRDPMTELFNHRHLHEVIYQLTSKAVLEDRKYSVIMLDIDRFKTINDTYGHQFGDKVLVGIADCLKQTVRDNDIVGRYGGEEFIVVLPDADAAQAYFVAERIRRNVSSTALVDDVRVTISGGVAQFDCTSGESVVEMADRELYRAKRNGRNRVEWQPTDIPVKEKTRHIETS